MEDTRPAFRFTDKKRAILTKIAQQPRKYQFFTHANNLTVAMHPDVTKGWIDEMVAEGLIVNDNDTFHITTMGRQRLDAKITATYRKIPDGYYRRGMGEVHQEMRPGALDFLKYKSVGQGC